MAVCARTSVYGIQLHLCRNQVLLLRLLGLCQHIVLMIANQARIVMLQHRTTTDQPPIDDLQELLLQEVDLLQADASHFGVVLVGVECIAERLGGAKDGSADETMYGQSANGKSFKAFAYAVDVDEQDEDATLFDRGVLCDSAQVGRERDVGGGSRVEASESRWVEGKRVVVFGQLDEHVDDEDEDVVEKRIVEQVR